MRVLGFTVYIPEQVEEQGKQAKHIGHAAFRILSTKAA